MAIILDADVVIRGEKGTFDLHGWLTGRPDDQFEVSAVTVAELWHSVERATGAHRVKRSEYLQTALALLPVIPIPQGEFSWFSDPDGNTIGLMKSAKKATGA